MGRIVLFGATGYTGRLTAEALVARGARPLLAARTEAKVRALAEELGGLEHAVAHVARPESVRALVSRGDVLLTTVGPFAKWGAPAVDAAVAAGAHYIDSTGEPPFIRAVFERHGPGAEAAGCTLLTAMGYDYVPGNLAGALALSRAGDAATAVRVGYFFTGGSSMKDMASGGTIASLAGIALEPGFAWRGGRLLTERAAARVGSFSTRGKTFGGASVAASEHFGLPVSHPGLRDVEVVLGGVAPARGMQAFSAFGSALARVPGVKTGAEQLVGRFVKGSTGGPDADARARSGCLLIAEALDGGGRVLERVELRGPNAYTYTGAILAWAADVALAGGLRATGAVGPVEAYGLETLQTGNASVGLVEE